MGEWGFKKNWCWSLNLNDSRKNAFFLGDPDSLKSFDWPDEATHSTDGNLLYSKSTGLNVTHILKMPSQQHLDWFLAKQVSTMTWSCSHIINHSLIHQIETEKRRAKTILQAGSRVSGAIHFTGLGTPCELGVWNSCDSSSLAHTMISTAAMATPLYAHHFPAVIQASHYFWSLTEGFLRISFSQEKSKLTSDSG